MFTFQKSTQMHMHANTFGKTDLIYKTTMQRGDSSESELVLVKKIPEIVRNTRILPSMQKES